MIEDDLMQRFRWLELATLSLFLLIVAAACRNQSAPAVANDLTSPVLTDLESIEQLQNAFKEGANKPRLLMILAPL